MTFHGPRFATAFAPASPEPVTFETFDHEAARREGWDLIEEGAYADGWPVQVQARKARTRI
jgi:hypothetical protein